MVCVAQVRIFRVSDLSCPLQLEGQHKETVMSVDVSADRRWVASGSKDRVCCLWELRDGRVACRVRMEGHTEAVGAVALSRRRHAFATNTAALFSAASDRTIKRWRLDLSAVADGSGVTVVTEAQATVLGHDKDINALAVSPNDAMLASASQDKTAKLWDAKTLAPIATLKVGPSSSRSLPPPLAHAR
jgi:U3 small nucleolar RNA-associated protein 13